MVEFFLLYRPKVSKQPLGAGLTCAWQRRDPQAEIASPTAPSLMHASSRYPVTLCTRIARRITREGYSDRQEAQDSSGSRARKSPSSPRPSVLNSTWYSAPPDKSLRQAQRFPHLPWFTSRHLTARNRPSLSRLRNLRISPRIPSTATILASLRPSAEGGEGGIECMYCARCMTALTWPLFCCVANKVQYKSPTYNRKEWWDLNQSHAWIALKVRGPLCKNSYRSVICFSLWDDPAWELPSTSMVSAVPSAYPGSHPPRPRPTPCVDPKRRKQYIPPL